MEGGCDVYDRFYTLPYFASMTSHAQQPIHQQQSPQTPIFDGGDASFTRAYGGNTGDVYSPAQVTDRHSIHSQTPLEHVYPSQQSYGTVRPYYSNVQILHLVKHLVNVLKFQIQKNIRQNIQVVIKVPLITIIFLNSILDVSYIMLNTKQIR